MADVETNPLSGVLKLSGITRSTKGILRVRNRIYHRVFDARWILSNMPDAELRRQRAAFKRGVIGATALVAVLMLPSPPTHTMMHSWSSSAVRATRSGLKRSRAQRSSRRGLFQSPPTAPSLWRAVSQVELHGDDYPTQDTIGRFGRRSLEWSRRWCLGSGRSSSRRSASIPANFLLCADRRATFRWRLRFVLELDATHALRCYSGGIENLSKNKPDY